MDPNEFTTDLHQYVQLRTMLDSLDIGALRYFLNATCEAEQQENYKYLRNALSPIIQKIWATPKESDCPPGYVECDGCCVPYNCVN